MTNRPADVTIGGRVVGPSAPPYIVAELSANHGGSLDKAIEILEMAHAAGADAVKVQTYRPDTITIDHDGPGFKIEGGLWDGRTLYSLYEEGHTPWEWHRPLFERGRELGIAVFSSPFDHTAVDFLETLDPPAYKIASFEIIDLPLIRRCAATGKPLIISTGMARTCEIADAVDAARQGGAGGLVLLHCTSGYPTPTADCDLRTIPHLGDAFAVPAGLSDHTRGIGAAVAAVALGACVIEKHVVMARADGGLDSAFSLEPQELRLLCDSARVAWEALGGVRVGRRPSEHGNVTLRRSLYVVADIPAGTVLTPETLQSIRPGHGLSPKYYDLLLGKAVNRDLTRGTPMSWDYIG